MDNEQIIAEYHQVYQGLVKLGCVNAWHLAQRWLGEQGRLAEALTRKEEP